MNWEAELCVRRDVEETFRLAVNNGELMMTGIASITLEVESRNSGESGAALRRGSFSGLE